MSTSGSLEGRVAIVTGAARGVGFAVAQTLVMEGARVVVADNGCAIDGGPEDSVAADAAVERLCTKAAGCAVAFSHSIAEPGAAQACVALTRETFGSVDIVINNAAILRHAPIDALGPDDIDAVLRTNLQAPIALLAAASPYMREQARGGRIPGAIVNVTSAAALSGRPGHAVYASAKAGLLGLTRSVAMDLAPSGIVCNVVVPFAGTRSARAMPAGNSAQIAARERAMRLPASYVANVIAFLCTSYAAGVTGQAFGVRGREWFVFEQPHPIATVFAEPGGFDAEAYAQLLGPLRRDFTDLRSDIERFDSDPVL